MDNLFLKLRKWYHQKRKVKALVGALPLFLLLGCQSTLKKHEDHPLKILEFKITPKKIRDAGLVTVEVKLNQPTDELFATVFDKDFSFYPKEFEKKESQEWILYLGIPYEQAPGFYSIQVKDVHKKLQVYSWNYRKEALRVEPKRVELTPEDLKRVLKEKEFLRSVYESSDLKPNWVGKFVLPLRTPITSYFGTQRVFNGVKKGAHLGADFRAPVGKPIRVTNQGKVVVARELFYSGNTVIVDHGMGILSLYGHLSKFSVAEGDVVKRAQSVGLAGATGRVTGPHLHWGAVVNSEKIDPIVLTELKVERGR